MQLMSSSIFRNLVLSKNKMDPIWEAYDFRPSFWAIIRQSQVPHINWLRLPKEVPHTPLLLHSSLLTGEISLDFRGLYRIRLKKIAEDSTSEFLNYICCWPNTSSPWTPLKPTFRSQLALWLQSNQVRAYRWVCYSVLLIYLTLNTNAHNGYIYVFYPH